MNEIKRQHDPKTARPPTIEQKIEQFIIYEERLQTKSIPYDAHLSLSGMLDSLSYAALLGFVHKEFDVMVNFHDASIEDVDTISKLAHLIRKQQAAKKRKR
jgi:acyl carrier protein